jgi:hypothetical protein
VTSNKTTKEGVTVSKYVPLAEEEMDFLSSYMEGFWKHLKSPQEKAYCAERSYQLVHGFKRVQGMSAVFGVHKDRVRNLEIVVRKVWLKGLEKWEAKQQEKAQTELLALYEELQLVGR